MMRILALLLFLGAGPAMACSCGADDRTLEQRIDDAERVVRVRVVAAELVGEQPPGATIYDRWDSERIAYRLRAIEAFKGNGGELPPLLGLAGTGGGDCTVRLEIGVELLLFVGPREKKGVIFSSCLQPYEPLGESDLLLDSARRFAHDRTPIHVCDNLRSSAWKRREECDARQDEWMRRREEARDRSRFDPG